MTRFDAARRITPEDALARLPGERGARFVELFRHGSLAAEVYAPVGRDEQKPHARDEVYVVLRGRGTWVSDAGRQPCGPGDFLFVPAGVAHRFEDFEPGFAVWVFFYGPEGGERTA